MWFKPLPEYTSATNLRVQESAGKPVLTWWQGDISVHGFGQGEDVILDAPTSRSRACGPGTGCRPTCTSSS